MFSWFGGNNKPNDQQNDPNNTLLTDDQLNPANNDNNTGNTDNQQPKSIFQNDDNTDNTTNTANTVNIDNPNNPITSSISTDDIKQQISTPFNNNSISPTQSNFPMHYAILSKNAVDLKKAISQLTTVDALLPDKMKPINKHDHHGYTALHLCVYLSWEEGIDILLDAGASPTVRSRSGWSSIQECISTSQRELLRKLFLRNMEEVKEGLALRSPIIRRKLCEKDDFYVEIDWKFSSWIPFVSRFCPSDTFKIWKRGSDFRLDMTLVDFESFKWKRGHISFIFIMNKKTDIAEFYVLNHDNKTKQVTNKQKEFNEQKDNQKDINDNIEQLLQSEIVSPEVLTSKIVIKKSKTWLGYDKTTQINGNQCLLYELNNLVVLANKKDNHVPEEVKKQRALTKQLFKSKIDESKKNKNKKIDDIWECKKCKHLNISSYVFCEECTTAKPAPVDPVPTPAPTPDNAADNDNNANDDNDVTDGVNDPPSTSVSQSASKSIVRSKSKSSLESIFGKIKKYDYAAYIPPNIDISEYFNVNLWNKNRMNIIKNKAHKKKLKPIKEIMNERKETFKINKAPSTLTSKSFKLNLAMTDHFGLTIEEILAILEAAAPQSKLAAKLKEFLEIKMPNGFPIQLELPLFHVLKAVVTFQNFEHINPDDEIFNIPDDYLLVEKDGNDINDIC